MKIMLAFQRLKRQTHGAGLCRRGAARHGAGSRPVTSMISHRSGWRGHRNESAPRLHPATSTERHLAPESARHLSGSRRCGEIAVSSSAPGGPWGVGDAREGWVVLRKGPWTRYKSFVPTRRKKLNPPTWHLLGTFCSASIDAFFGELPVRVRRRFQGACGTKRVSAACPVPRTSTASAWIVREHVSHSLKTVQTRKR